MSKNKASLLWPLLSIVFTLLITMPVLAESIEGVEVAPAIPTELFGAGLQIFPQIAIGGTATTFFSIHSTSDETITMRIELYGSDGSLLYSQELQLLAGATETVVPDLGLATTTVGWARLSATGTFSSTEFLQFRNAAGQLLTQVDVLPSEDQKTLTISAAGGGSVAMHSLLQIRVTVLPL